MTNCQHESNHRIFVAYAFGLLILASGCNQKRPLEENESDSLTPRAAITATSIAVPATETSTTNVPEPANRTVEVPKGIQATIDGEFSPGEWDEAMTIDVDGKGELLLMHSEGYLYLGIRSQRMGYGSLCVARGNEVWILHSSAALGSTVLERDGESWRKTQDFSWCCRSSSATSARDSLLEEEGWVANIGFEGPPNEMEYQIALKGGSLIMAIVYQESSKLETAMWWPTDLDDDCLQTITLDGIPPEMATFSLGSWGEFLPSDS